MLRHFVRSCWRVVAATALAAAIPLGAQAQGGTVTGTVTDAETSAPLSTVQVAIQGTSIGALTSAQGEFSLTNVPPGTYTILAQRIGYQEARQTSVTISAGSTTTVNLSMSPAVLALQGIVATGLIDPVEGVRAPIAVSRITREMMPVAASGAAVQNLQGRIAGMRVARQSGQPGSDITMILRTPTSVTGSGAPLIVVDGVILGGGTSTIDIDGMDIENVEVIKGAAASSLYGSRAASGVIAITTKRGQSLEAGNTQFTARAEMGITQALKHDYLASHHRFRMDPTNSYYVDAAGNRVERNARTAPVDQIAFMDKPYPGATFNNIDAVASPGGFQSYNLSILGNSITTNFAIALNNYHEGGALVGNDGYRRNSLRLNLDHRFQEAFSVGMSVYHARDGRENITGTNPFDAAIRAPIDIDFTLTDPVTGLYRQQPDPTENFQNPLWTQQTRENDQNGTRTLVNGNATWSPAGWITASAAAGYDRGDFNSRLYVPKGTPGDVGVSDPPDGELTMDNDVDDTWNAEAQLSFRRDIGALNLRTTFRGVLEESYSYDGQRSAENFTLFGVPQFGAFPETADVDATSEEQSIWAEGYLWDTALDYDGKYIFTVLGRRDGSSLFGPDNRWHNYYRVAGAWRLGEESWFNLPHVSEFKISLARGTAGGRPGFNAQYETWTLNQGIPTKSTLGNRELAPEHTTEHEISLNAILFERIGVVLTHARQKTTDQLVQAPQSIITGYVNQWINAGTVEGFTTELEIEGQLIRRENLGWTMMVVGDKSYSEITDWPIPCDATNAWRLYCEGEPVYGVYALHLVQTENDTFEEALAKHRGGELLEAPYVDQFEVNDEGYIVWVGTGNTYKDGIAKSLWGTSTDINGKVYEWGVPFHEQDEHGANRRQRLGQSNPYNFGWINNVRLGGFNFHAQLQGSIGADGNNRATHSLITAYNSKVMDQSGKEDGLKKPVNYYRQAINGNTDYVVEDASYIKLRTLSAAYQFNAASLGRFGLDRAGISGLTLGLIARNVFTITGYDGFDPEAALNLANRSNADGGGYPSTRNLTAEVTVTF
jgi:TonB-linked SusC/RagA family outer membrane protein